MRSEVTLRSAEPADESLLRAVYASTRAEELAPTGWSDEQKAQFCDSQFTAQDIHYRTYYGAPQFLVIERGGVPAGRLYVDRAGLAIHIIDVALLPEHRRHGVGTELLRGLQAEAAAAGRPLTIHVEKFNPALELYQRLGFREIGDQGVYLLLEWSQG